ncbi:MAG: ribulose-phosphate 3-epimerase, partial [Spirochaetaceae bacterium]|nr:ribulose-phosphate 3-epimerase [Spirochaetaceae bacterium]
LEADFADLGGALRTIEERSAGLVHIDVMDGAFVPEISYGQPVVRALRPCTALPFDVHLMVEHPETHIESFIRAGADYLTFHLEAAVHHHRIVQMIHEQGKKAGIALVPSTPISALSEILPYIDLVLVMSVNPGFGGQQFIELSFKKIRELADIQRRSGTGFLISVDGGVNEKNCQQVFDAGADIVVSGSAFFTGALKWGQ